MSQLAPKLFDRRFEDLMEIGRAQIPALAPEWTDHNAHDPGITLMELLAWVAEAQVYSLSRVRRDERSAYAALLGIDSSGTQSAVGTIWADRDDPNSPLVTFRNSAVIPDDTLIRIAGTTGPVFTPTARLLWIPGRITKLETRSSGGGSVDHTSTNDRGRIAFLPFGEKAGPRDVLAMTFAGRDDAGMFGTRRADAKGALWPIGVRVAQPLGDEVRPSQSEPQISSSLVATLVTDVERVRLRVASDTTQAFMTSGVIMLDLDDVTKQHKDFTIEFRSAGGFARPPQVVRIEPSVIPIQQGRTISDDVKGGNGMPDLSFALSEPGLKFASDEEPVTVEVAEDGSWSTWLRSKSLWEHGPDDTVFEFDPRTEEITFGNGVNGRIPSSGSPIRITYKVSDGEAGNVARNRKWNVPGFEGVFGVNPDPISGGTSASDFTRQRREARARVRADHALVTSGDIEKAATDLRLLEVARSWVVKPVAGMPRTGVVTLVALRARRDEDEPDDPPETTRWLEAIRRQLVRRMPLGTRLNVKRPDYRDFSIRAVVEAYKGLDPANIKSRIEDELVKRLALVGRSPRMPGVSVSQSDFTAWIRGVDGVKAVNEVELRTADGVATVSIKVPRGGLPRWRNRQSTITVNREGSGGRNEY